MVSLLLWSTLIGILAILVMSLTSRCKQHVAVRRSGSYLILTEGKWGIRFGVVAASWQAVSVALHSLMLELDVAAVTNALRGDELPMRAGYAPAISMIVLAITAFVYWCMQEVTKIDVGMRRAIQGSRWLMSFGLHQREVTDLTMFRVLRSSDQHLHEKSESVPSVLWLAVCNDERALGVVYDVDPNLVPPDGLPLARWASLPQAR